MMTLLVPALSQAQQKGRGQQQNWIDLPSSKQLGPVPGDPRRVNSLPAAMAISPDGRYVVTVNAGYGTVESKYEQSLAVMDTRTGEVKDFPDDRTNVDKEQTLYSGLAFSADGRHVYASLASVTDADAGNGIAVYGFDQGRIVPEREINIGSQKLAGGRRTNLPDGVLTDEAVSFPAGLATAGNQLLVADNLSDDALLIDTAKGKVVTRFDLSESDTVPSTYPIAVAVSKDGKRGFVALWNASEVVELDLAKGAVVGKLPLLKPSDPLKPGTHPCALVVSPDGKTLYVALSNRDAVAAVDIGDGRFAVKGYFDTRLPGQSYFGAEPDALALSADGERLYAANLGSDAVAVIDTKRLTRTAVKDGFVEPVGFIPTEWMPTALMVEGTGGGQHLFVATAKGRSTGPNNFPQRSGGRTHGPYMYIATLLYGSLAAIDLHEVELKAATEEVLESNRMKAAAEKIAFAGGADPIKHVIYVIKENRTYDQILGDLKQNGTPVGNGDPSLTMYGQAVTPNQHELALRFGVLDNFFDSGEVSGDGHVWSNAAIGTDYLERNWQIDYRNAQRNYDYEGVVAQGYPILQKIPDVVEPQSGYMWGNADAHGRTHYNFGEYISSTFCDAKKSGSSQEGPVLGGSPCKRNYIRKGEAIPAEWGGGVSKWPWPIPLLERNVATKPELVGHYAPESPDFNVRVPDQIRMNVFLRHFAGWVKERSAGRDTMPDYITMRLGDDHTAGTTPGGPTPKASVADNDLAVGRLVDAVSHSAYWDDTAIFILEDDAQNGGDHVDAHRSTAYVISKYAPHGDGGRAFIDSRFYTTVSVIRTMETLLGLPPMNNNDALAPLIGSLFTGPGDQAPFTADTTNQANGLIYAVNGRNAVGAKASAKMDFTHEDRVDPRVLNVILWKDAMGNAPVPAQLLRKPKKVKDDDDD
ncbi:MAG TPA: bifunctional YncE family protein/alkaline phosphatase family protein [Acidobacteriaceae bacterium]|nr:bifunctional YncE family protein/alkaline phosphatase family protein [Acidobacteriaceae bacterium]